MTNDKTFWFIRHAESEGNAGMVTTSAGGIPLTERGHAQAQHLAQHIDTPPDLFVISPYLRTVQTAQPSLDKYPSIPVETWPIQEYTYLPAEVYRSSTTAQRNKPAVDYFRKGDPDLILGDGAESFNQLIARVNLALDRVIESPHRSIYLFSHGWYIRTMLWRLIFFPGYETNLNLDTFSKLLPKTGFGYKVFSKFFSRVGQSQMNHFLLFSSVFSIPNGSVLKFNLNSENGEIYLNQITTDHIPPELRGTHLGNR